MNKNSTVASVGSFATLDGPDEIDRVNASPFHHDVENPIGFFSDEKTISENKNSPAKYAASSKIACYG